MVCPPSYRLVGELMFPMLLLDPESAVSPALLASMHQLERQFKADQISRQLRKRPSVSVLEEAGIINGMAIRLYHGS